MIGRYLSLFQSQSRKIASRKLASGIFTLGLGSFIAGFALQVAPAVAADPVKQRIEHMKAVGDAIGKLAAIMKGQADFNGAAVAAAGQAIADNMAAAQKLFPAGSTSDKSRAKAEIWSENATFIKGFEMSAAAAAGVVKIGKEDDEFEFLNAVGALGKTCKGCHEKFRKPKEN